MILIRKQIDLLDEAGWILFSEKPKFDELYKMKPEAAVEEVIRVANTSLRLQVIDEQEYTEIKVLLNRMIELTPKPKPTPYEKKKINFKESIKRFEQSERTSDDYQKLFVEFYGVIRPDNGLIWSEIENVINEALSEIK